ncbi:MAG: WD40 repeat domain-containing protein [Candidatus Thermoplasmatota archaeon]|nr:WD40 repeat domain-containing protein [Candidatus Thermoplasmatota archaeon]
MIGMRVFALFLASILISSPVAIAQSTIMLGEIIDLDEVSLGLEGASISPDGKLVIAHGADSSIYLIDPENPNNHSKVSWIGDSTLLDSSFHPQGDSALIAGTGGTLLRYISSNLSIEEVGSGSEFGGEDLRSVSWNSDGSWAFVGGEAGSLWKVRSIDGELEIHPIEGSGDSAINAISCIPGSRYCVISSNTDGIGVIDENQDLHWLGGVGYPWIDVVCPSGEMIDCVAVSTDVTIAVIRIEIDDVSSSTVYPNDIVQLQGIQGMITGVQIHSEGRSLISLAPFGIIEHDLELRKSFDWIKNSVAAEYNLTLSDERIVSSWSNGAFSGWILTGEGSLVHFSPVEEEEKSGILDIWIGIVILGGTALLVASLITSSSPRISRWVAIKIGSEEERSRAIREQRRIDRKNKRA